MRCPFCGKKSKRGEKNCPQCGKALVRVTFLQANIPGNAFAIALWCIAYPLNIIIVSLIALWISRSLAVLIFPIGLGVFIGVLTLRKAKTDLEKFLAVIFIFIAIISPLCIVLFFAFGNIIGYKTTVGAYLYGECEKTIDILKEADKAYFSRNGKHAENVESLELYLDAACSREQTCGGKDRKEILKACTDYSIQKGATSTIKITGRARDEFHCLVCDPKKTYSRHEKWECPATTTEGCR